MALCTLSGGYSTDSCGPSNGGTKSLGIMIHDKSKDYKIQETGAVAADPVAGHNDTGLVLRKIEQEMETAVVTETMAADRKTNTRSFSTSIQVTIPYSSLLADNVAIDSFVEEVTKSNMVISVEDNSGVTKLYGCQNGMRATASDGGPGTVFEDLNGVVITFTGKESTRAPFIGYNLTPAGGADAYVIPS